MGGIAESFLTSYVIMPLLAVIMGVVAYILAKKNKILKNKKLILYMILGSLFLSLPGFLGFIDYWFMPYTYIALQVLYLLLGWYNIKIIRYFYPDLDSVENKKPYYIEFLMHFLMMFIGAAFFSLIFNLCNELQYGLWACTCLLTFIFPTLFRETYRSYMNIPLEIYKVWKYNEKNDLSTFDEMDYNKLHVMELEVFKNVLDTTPSKIKAKAPDNMPFGIWFQKFLTDYNIKFTSTPIEVRDRSSNEPYCWIFYTKPSFFLPRHYIDYELSITENNIRENHTIIVKRVSESTNEEINKDNPASDKEPVIIS